MKCEFCKQDADNIYEDDTKSACCDSTGCQIKAVMRLNKNAMESLVALGISLDKFDEEYQKLRKRMSK